MSCLYKRNFLNFYIAFSSKICYHILCTQAERRITALKIHTKGIADMKIAINILKVLEIILTAIWGIVFGIFTPLALMSNGIVADEIAQHFVLKLWLINSIVFYCIGTIIVMLKYYKLALCFHVTGTVISLVIYGIFSDIYNGVNAQNPAVLYMPVIFVTFVTLAITIIANFKKINAWLSSVKEKQYEAAPSVLGGEYVIKEEDKNSKKGSKKAKKEQ